MLLPQEFCGAPEKLPYTLPSLPTISTILLRDGARSNAINPPGNEASLELPSPMITVAADTPPWPTAEPHSDGSVSDEQPRQGRDDMYASKHTRKNVLLCHTQYHLSTPKTRFPH